MKIPPFLHTVRCRLLLLAIVVEALMLALMVANSLRLLDSFMKEQAVSHVKQVIPVVTAAMVAPLAQRDYATVQAIAEECRASDGIEYVVVTDRDNASVAQSPRMPTGFAPGTSPTEQLTIRAAGKKYDVDAAISLQGQRLGTLHFGFDISKIKAARRALLSQGIAIAVVELMLTTIILSLTFFWLTRRLSLLTSASIQVSEGNLAELHLSEGDDDLGRLGSAFNTMTRAINERVRQLIEAKEAAEAGEKARAEGERRYRLALEGANLGTWDWDIPSGRISVNERWAEMLGYTLDEIEPHVSFWENLVHPDDVARVRAVLQEHLQGGTETYETEHRARHKSGTWIWVLDRGRAISRDDQGAPLRACGTHLDITVRMSLDEKIRRSQANFNTFFDISADFLFVLDTAGNIIKVNRTVTRRLGYAEEDLAGRSILMIHPPDVRDEAGAIVAAMLAGSRDCCPLPLQAGDGRLIPVETRVIKGVWDGKPALYGTSKDISDLAFSEEKFAKAFEFSASLMAISTVEEGRFIEVNRTFLHTLGFSREEVIGKTSHELGLIPDSAVREKIMAELTEIGFVANTELTVPTRSGESRVGLFSANRIRIQGNPYLLTVMNDITEAKKMERELERATEEAVLANKAKGLFVANVSHEIRTPLNEILGLSHLLSDTGLNEKQHDYQVKIIRAAKSLLQIINDILDFSKIEAGKLDIRNEPFNPREAVHAVMESLRPFATEKHLDIRCDVSLAVPSRVIGSSHRLSQILANLVHNAIKFTDTGSVSVTADVIASVQDRLELEFRVIDTGIGIPETKRDHLFQAFSQVDNSSSRRFGGTGLGLAICRQLCDAMGGAIRMESTPGMGSTFVVRLPFITGGEPSADITQQGSVLALADGFVPVFRGARILVVDDNEINRHIAHELLSKYSAEVSLAEDGAQAVECVRLRAFDIVLLDIQMPVMDGISAARTIRSLGIPRVDSMPLIAMTAHAMSGDREKFITAGMNDYLTKPFEPDELYRVVARWLPRAEVEATAGVRETVPDETGLHLQDVDVRSGLRRAGGKPDFYRKLLRKCVHNHRDSERKIRTLLGEGNAEEARRLAHSIKGWGAIWAPCTFIGRRRNWKRQSMRTLPIWKRGCWLSVKGCRPLSLW